MFSHLRGITVTPRHVGACRNGTTAAPNTHCDDICDEVKSPLCASDGQVYGEFYN